MVFRFPRIISGIYWVSDAAWARVFTERPGTGAPGELNYVGEASHFTTLFFLWLTKGLPFRRELWEVFPLLMALAGAALLGWGVTRLSGRWAGILAFCIATCAAPSVLITTLPEGIRSHTWFGMLASSAVVVYLVHREESLGIVRLVAIAACLALGLGALLASDPLFLVAGLLPILGAAAAVGVLVRTKQSRRLSLALLGSVMGAVLVAGAISRITFGMGFRKTYLNTGYTFATLDEMLGSVKTAIGDVLLMSNGYVLGRPVGPRSVVELGAGVAGLVALALPLLLLRRLILSGYRDGRFDRAKIVYLVFWVTVELATLGSFILSSVAAGTGPDTARYLVPLFYVVAATVPVWAAELQWKRGVALAGATVFCLLGVSALRGDGLPQLYGVYNYETTPMVKAGPAIIEYLQGRNVTRGYSNYWYSHALAYRSDLKLEVSPVFECQRPTTKLICPFFVNTRTGWYVPEPGVRTFLITDSGRTGLPENTLLSSPPWDALGPPAEERKFGEFTVYLYDYDIASKML